MNNAALSLVSSENREEINNRIADMQARTTRSYSECRNEVRRQFPRLFGTEDHPVVNNRAVPGLSFADTENDEGRARRIADAIQEYRINNPAASYIKSRDAVRRQRPEIFAQ